MERPHSQLHLWLASLFVVTACAALPIDLVAAEFAKSQRLPGDVRKLFDVSEVFAHGLGVLLILIAALVLDPVNRPRLPRVAACAYGAGLVAQFLKYVLPRVRPNAVDDFASVTALGTFLPWQGELPEQLRQLGSSAIQSFPSGHTATAVGLAWGLSWLYPRGRWLFAIFALLAAAQRVQSSAHFVSDTLFAAAIGTLVAGVVLNDRGVGRWFGRLEAR